MARPEILDQVGHDFQSRPLLPGLLVLPSIHLETPLDEDAAALLEILDGVLGGPTPDGDLDEGRLLLSPTVLPGPSPVEGEAELGNGGSGFRLPELGLASQVSQQGHTIITAHMDIKR